MPTGTRQADPVRHYPTAKDDSPTYTAAQQHNQQQADRKTDNHATGDAGQLAPLAAPSCAERDCGPGQSDARLARMCRRHPDSQRISQPAGRRFGAHEIRRCFKVSRHRRCSAGAICGAAGTGQTRRPQLCRLRPP